MMDFIKYPVITEKAYLLLERNKYTFDVDPRLTKPQIKKIFENIFKVKVMAVNSHLLPLKSKRLGLKKGYKARYKRIIITLQKDLPTLF